MGYTSDKQSGPMTIKEITLRGILLGVFITVIFTAAQVYLGLKVGLTFATSIPAAVISMALLRFFKTSTIQENTTVQTIASAAGTLASVIFVLPGLIMIGWWKEVPFWITFGACAVGGILGVMYTIPLRRALVVNSTLPYPEGVAAAEVLKVGTGSRQGSAEGSDGLNAIIIGTVVSALYALLKAGKLFAAEIAAFTKIHIGQKVMVTGLMADASLALMGAGHLMGIRVGLAMLAGLVIAWGGLVPFLSLGKPIGDDIMASALSVWKSDVRFIGAGVIGVAALWTLGTLAKPVWSGLMSAIAASDHKRMSEGGLPRTDRDIPVTLVGIITLGTLVPGALLMAAFLQGTEIVSLSVPLVAAGVAYMIFAGFLAAAVCGYMAGLIGSSNSPVSGIAILSIWARLLRLWPLQAL